MTLQSIRDELLKVERRRAQLQNKIANYAKQRLLKLPSEFGLRSVDELIALLLPHSSPQLRSRWQTEVLPTGVNQPKGTVRTRGERYSAEVKSAVRSALEAGKKSAKQISEEYGPSIFTITAWKRQFGLTRARGRHSSKTVS